MSNVELPHDYEPFPTLVLCSNELANVKVPLMASSKPTLLIGIGDESVAAKIWLQRPAGSPFADTWEWVIEGNESRSSDVKLLISGPSFGVYQENDMIMHLTVSEERRRADVISLDLRPFGMAIHGNMQGLNVAGNKMVGNHFRNIHTMIKIDV
jgi:hypothetical protein